MTNQTDDQLWLDLLAQARSELLRLPAGDLASLKQRLALIAGYQQQLDQLFVTAAGEEACAACLGGCCGCGRHHFTLTNLLGYLCHERQPPAPDFSRSCPFLGDCGCLLAPGDRPFNCITFLCEALEERLSTAERDRFYDLEKQLRLEYEAIAKRYPMASLRGVWIALERYAEQPLLPASATNMVK